MAPKPSRRARAKLTQSAPEPSSLLHDRSAKNAVVASTFELPEESNSGPRTKKPGRKGKTTKEPSPQLEPDLQALERQGRPRREVAEVSKESATESSATGSAWGRKEKAAEVEVDADELNEGGSTVGLTKKGKNKKGKGVDTPDRSTEISTISELSKRGKKRKDGIMEPQEASIGPFMKKRQRRARQQETTVGPAVEENPQERSRELPDDEIEDPSFAAAATSIAPKPRKRNRTSNQPQGHPGAPLSPPPSSPQPGTKALSDSIAAEIPHLAPKVQHIPHGTISSKWTPLAPESRTTVQSLLHLAAQPALSRTGTNETRHRASVLAVRAVSKRILSKLSRGLPFPAASIGGIPVPGNRRQKRKDTDNGRADEFDFEKVVTGVRVVEGELDKLLHSVALLEREKAKLEKEMEREHEAVIKLEGAVKKEATLWKDSLKKAHPLVPEISPTLDPRLSNFTIITPSRLPGGAFRHLSSGISLEDDKDIEVRDLARTVASHMESIKGNMGQIEGVVPQIRKTKGALQAVLGKALGQEALGRVFLGASE